MSPRQKRAAAQGIIIGMLATAATLVVHWTGWLDWLEFKTLDLRFQFANSIREHPDIVCIDIDDPSLDKVGRWPWSRDDQAALISVPAELGARRILVDISWVEHEALAADVLPNVDMLADPLDLLHFPLPLRSPDEVLRDAIQRAGNVYLSVIYDPDAWEQSRDFRTVLDALRAGNPDPAALSRQLHASDRRISDLLNAGRVVLALEADISLDTAAATQRAGVDPNFGLTVFERCRHYVIREFVRSRLAADPALTEAPRYETAETLYKALTNRPFENGTPQRIALLKILREQLGYQATLRTPPTTFERVKSIAAEADTVVPVYFAFARAARHCGFVKFDPDSDGIMRRNALFAAHDGNVLGQLAFVLACDELGVGPNDIEVTPGRLTLRPSKPGAAPIVLQLDEHGRVVVPWSPRREWIHQFGQHVPADAVWQVYDRRRLIERNEADMRDLRAEFYGTSFFDQPGPYLALVAERREAELIALHARYRGTPAEVDQAAAAIADIDRRTVELEALLIEETRAELEQINARPEAERDLERLDRLTYRLSQLDRLEMLSTAHTTAIPRLREEIDRTLAWLRPHIENKICLIGYTATALADMTPIPTNPRAPGVIAHANLLSALLYGRGIRFTVGWQDALLASAAGLLATLASALRRPRTSFIITVGAFVALCAAAALAFYLDQFWIVIAPALLAIVLSYAAIAFYRYVFIDRERRQLATSLSQYTSSALARQMAENADLCKRAETREVTAMFTDFAGFTTISERIGAERTQRVLNLSLGRISDVMLRHEAMINKFIGDGVFAFWNPVIYPQTDHAARACATAVELLERLADLIAEQAAAGGDQAFVDLKIRIGVASGRAVVGPCGSEQKYDYTCIGDSVNVAARLESANKFFGTRILTNDGTRSQLDSTYAFRSLGLVRVKGRHEPVGVFELLGRTARVAAATLEYAERFGAAAKMFQERRWDDARSAFEQCRRLRPDDLAAEFYALTAAAHVTNPPPADEWAGTIELSEK